MVLIDGIVYGVTALSAAVSISRGLVREILTLMSWGISVACLMIALEPLATTLLAYQLQSPLNWIVAGACICVGVWILVRAINSSVRVLFKGLGITWFDKLLGCVFGIVRGILLSWLIVWSVILTMGPDHPWMTDAKTPYLLNQWGDTLQHMNWDEKNASWMQPIAPYVEQLKVSFLSLPSTAASIEHTFAKHDHASKGDPSL